MKVEFGSRPVVTVTLMDGTVLVRESIQSVIDSLEVKIKSCTNCINHYAEETKRLERERELLVASVVTIEMEHNV